MSSANFKKGVSLVEVVVGATIISLSLIGLVTAYNFYLKIAFKNTDIVKSSFLLEEGMEAVRSLRDINWSNISSLALNNNYYLYFNDYIWQATTSNQYIDDIFERSFVLADVYRDADDNIAPSGTLDPNIKKITVFVSWHNGQATTTKTISGYLANIFGD